MSEYKKPIKRFLIGVCILVLSLVYINGINGVLGFITSFGAIWLICSGSGQCLSIYRDSHASKKRP